MLFIIWFKLFDILLAQLVSGLSLLDEAAAPNEDQGKESHESQIERPGCGIEAGDGDEFLKNEGGAKEATNRPDDEQYPPEIEGKTSSDNG